MIKNTKIKSSIAFAVVIAMICIGFSAVVAWNNNSTMTVLAKDGDVITMQIGNPKMTVNGTESEIDTGVGTVPVVVNDRTLLPIRAVIEAVGGSVEWNESAREVLLTYENDNIRLTIDSTTMYLNDIAQTLDTAPIVINDRTMFPIRFIAEGFGFEVTWEETTLTVTIKANKTNTEAPTATPTTDGTEPVVYMTTEITPEALVNIYNQLGFTAEGNVAVKMSTGEPPNSNYLRPELIKDLVQSVNGTIVECNTAYGGARSATEMHRQVIEDHGFNDIAKVDIMDENGSISIPIKQVEGIDMNLQENFVGANIANYDSLISLAHFKGHAMAGYGGAIKNMSIGIGSREGKSWIHTAGNSKESTWGGEQDKFLESMAEATSGVVDYLEGKVVYVNVMNRLSVDCDCDGNPAEPDMHDIGILASADPVALDQACLDLVYAQKDADGAALVERIESRNGLHTLEQAEKIGIGSRTYNLVSIDS